jgi:quercetin dioxygenase-like cupin family protein
MVQIMDTSDKLARIRIEGKAHDQAMAAFQEQLSRWQLKMPPVRPLVTDLGLGRFYEIGYISYVITNQIEAGYCGKYLFVFDGQTLPLHHHKAKHETFFIVKGKVKMSYKDDHFEMQEGDTLSVECDVKHGFSGIGAALVLEVSQAAIVDDNYFVNPKIPLGGNYIE